MYGHRPGYQKCLPPQTPLRACVRASVLAPERAQVRETHFQHLHYTQPINTRQERWPGPVAVDVVVVISGHLSWPLARTGAWDDGKLHVT